MFGRRTDGVLTLAFLMTDNMSLMSLACAIEPLRAANRLLGRQAFRWLLCSADGAPVTTSSNFEFKSVPIDLALTEANAIFVCGGMRANPQTERSVLAVLRKAARQGKAIGALSTASYLLARAGLLEGYRCTIHWENGPAFSEEFPDIVNTGKLYEIDRNRLTCSGGIAAMDMMLHIISDLHGADLARGVANQFHHERIRHSREDQQGGRLQQVEALPLPLQQAIKFMKRNIAIPLGIDNIAHKVGVSTRQLERLFKAHLRERPARYYLMLRTEHAREMLLYTDIPVIEISVSTGFASASHLSKWLKAFFQKRPTQLRQTDRATPGRDGHS